MNERSSRQSFLGPDSDRILQDLTSAIVGLGGGGSHIAQQLAHIGIGSYQVYDPDYVELSNLNRLVGATFQDVQDKTLKIHVATRMIQGINPDANVVAESSRWQDRAEHLREVDVIFGCVDSFADRAELERFARRMRIPYIDIGMDVHEAGGRYAITGQVALSMPGSACLHCMGVLRPDLLAQEAARYGEAGPRPQVTWPNGVLASMAVGILMQLVTPWHDGHQSVQLLEYDGNIPEIRPSTATSVLIGQACPHYSESGDLGDPWFRPLPLT